MRITTYSEARNNFKAIIDSTIDDADITVIHRRDGQGAVLMGRDQYDSLMETLHLLSNPANAAHLAKSVNEYKEGKAKQRQLIDSDE
ncbi:MAG: type II toxin-antitoxin system Phd/YefM family antitoxin [Formosimonas sp.]